MPHVEKVYSVKSKIIVSNPLSQCDAGVFCKLDVVSGLKSLPSFFCWSLKEKTANGKKLVKMVKCRHVCYHICQRNRSFPLRKNVSNL